MSPMEPSGIRTPAPLALSLALAVALAACAPAAPPAGTVSPSTPAAAPAADRDAPPSVRWFRTAAEQRLVYELVFREALEAVETAALDTEAPWGVIVDADETLLDNSLYQLERAEAGLGFTSESWNDWVRREEATALPGARAFAERVQFLGGRVAVVTNRDESVCEATRRNLRAQAIPFDVVLCRVPGVSEKETRFRMVQEGITPAGLPPLRVLAWVGDNLRDFPGGSQELRHAQDAALAGFGTLSFVLPNPMYGSWEDNPVR